VACGSCGGGKRRTSTAARQRTSTQTRQPVAGEKWEVTLPDGQVHSDLTEHEALMLTLRKGGAMELQGATPN